MKKRVILFLLTALIIMTLTSCSGGQSDTSAQTEDNISVNDSDTTVKDENPITMERGTIDDNVYYNEVTNITFAKPESMIYATDDEIAQTINITKEQLNSNDLFENAAVTTVIDFMVSDPMTGNNINVSYENLSKSNASNITMEQYIEIFKNNVLSMYPESYGYTFSEVEEITLGSDKYHKIIGLCTVEGITMEQGIYLRKVDKYMVSIAITTVDGTDLSVYEKCFS